LTAINAAVQPPGRHTASSAATQNRHYRSPQPAAFWAPLAMQNGGSARVFELST